MSYDCVTAILESIQLLKGDEEGTSFEKHRKLVNIKDKNKETALHVAIENKAPKVVAYLLENQANMLAKLVAFIHTLVTFTKFDRFVLHL